MVSMILDKFLETCPTAFDPTFSLLLWTKFSNDFCNTSVTTNHKLGMSCENVDKCTITMLLLSLSKVNPGKWNEEHPEAQKNNWNRSARSIIACVGFLCVPKLCYSYRADEKQTRLSSSWSHFSQKTKTKKHPTAFPRRWQKGNAHFLSQAFRIRSCPSLNKQISQSACISFVYINDTSMRTHVNFGSQESCNFRLQTYAALCMVNRPQSLPAQNLWLIAVYCVYSSRSGHPLSQAMVLHDPHHLLLYKAFPKGFL